MCGCKAVEVVRWAGLDWLGMPAPVRVAAWVVFTARGGREWPLRFCRSRWAGCGCVKAWKDWAERFR